MESSRKEFLHYVRPWVGEEEIKELKDVLDSGWLTTGPKSQQFEELLKRYIGCKNVVVVSSCTAAIHLSLLALGIGKGDEVIIPDLAFMSDGGVVELVGAKPIPADIDPETLTISMLDLRRRITPKTKAIIPVHYAGHPCELDEILEFAKERNIAVVQDAAHALGAEYKGKKIGAVGEVACFSFHAVKNITGGEGGAIAASDDEIAERVGRSRLFGIRNRRMVDLGYKYNMSELHAAVGIAQLRKLPMFQHRREEIAKSYSNALADNEYLDLPIVRSYVKHAWHLFVVKLNLQKLRCSRDDFKNQLTVEKVGSQVHFEPIHAQPYFSDRFDAEEYPQTNRMYQRILSIPFYPKMSNDDVSYVIATMKRLLDRNRHLV